MDKDQVKGKLKEATGEVKQHVGRATGDKDQELRGHAEEQEGKLQKKVGDVKDAADKIVRKP
jgi:uncharacterized protein YjbJ (UPF0337 family)